MRLGVGELRGVSGGIGVRVGRGVHEGSGVFVAAVVAVAVGSDRTIACVGVGFSLGSNPLRSEGEIKAAR